MRLKVSLSAFAFLFSELVLYNQTQVDNITKLERSIMQWMVFMLWEQWCWNFCVTRRRKWFDFQIKCLDTRSYFLVIARQEDKVIIQCKARKCKMYYTPQQGLTCKFRIYLCKIEV